MSVELIAALAGMIIGVIAWISGRESGKDSERVDTQDEVLDNAKKAKEVQETVAGGNADSNRKRLRDEYGK